MRTHYENFEVFFYIICLKRWANVAMIVSAVTSPFFLYSYLCESRLYVYVKPIWLFSLGMLIIVYMGFIQLKIARAATVNTSIVKDRKNSILFTVLLLGSMAVFLEQESTFDYILHEYSKSFRMAFFGVIVLIAIYWSSWAETLPILENVRKLHLTMLDYPYLVFGASALIGKVYLDGDAVVQGPLRESGYRISALLLIVSLGMRLLKTTLDIQLEIKKSFVENFLKTGTWQLQFERPPTT